MNCGTIRPTNRHQTTIMSQKPTTSSSLRLPIRMTSVVIHGYGRGSTELGIPTANLDPSRLTISYPPSTTSDASVSVSAATRLDDLETGIYYGFCCIKNKNNEAVVYKSAMSMGYNPTYGNDRKTIEPHFIASASDPCRHKSKCGETLLEENCYDEEIRLSIVGYLRPELPFEGVEKLIAAIKEDIAQSDKLCEAQDAITLREKEWVRTGDI